MIISRYFRIFCSFSRTYGLWPKNYAASEPDYRESIFNFLELNFLPSFFASSSRTWVVCSRKFAITENSSERYFDISFDIRACWPAYRLSTSRSFSGSARTVMLRRSSTLRSRAMILVCAP